jgi:hypothetical protein
MELLENLVLKEMGDLPLLIALLGPWDMAGESSSRWTGDANQVISK